uniref:RGS domain-containing protein n=1 Tax=Denticeps clupeoides TaxID=299321 RepID=A0AAY4A9G7_9TELE
MESLLFLFPHFNFVAPEEEVYFKMPSLADVHGLRMKGSSSGAKNKDTRSRLSLLLTKSGSHENVSPDKKPTAKVSSISPDEALKWNGSFEELLGNSDGVETFTQFLRTEFSEENIEFWLACEEYKKTQSNPKLLSNAKQIYAIYIDTDAPKEINIDHSTKATIQKNIADPTASCFDAAQSKIYSLMKKDCYPRFLTSDVYLSLIKRKPPGTMTRRRSRSFVFNDKGELASGSWL